MSLRIARRLLVLLGLVAQTSLLFGDRSEPRSLAVGYARGMSLEDAVFLLVPGLVTLAGIVPSTATSPSWDRPWAPLAGGLHCAGLLRPVPPSR